MLEATYNNHLSVSRLWLQVKALQTRQCQSESERGSGESSDSSPKPAKKKARASALVTQLRVWHSSLHCNSHVLLWPGWRGPYGLMIVPKRDFLSNQIHPHQFVSNLFLGTCTKGKLGLQGGSKRWLASRCDYFSEAEMK